MDACVALDDFRIERQVNDLFCRYLPIPSPKPHIPYIYASESKAIRSDMNGQLSCESLYVSSLV